MRIIHISDLHFGMQRPGAVEAFLEILHELKADLVLISGDLTQRATEHQYELCHHFLGSLGVPYVAVPGNHDIPLHSLRRFIHPFKLYKKYIAPELISRWTNEQVNILGVNSATPFRLKKGNIDNKQMHLIQHHFADKKSEHFNILFFHHNIHYFSGLHQPLDNANEVIDYVKTNPIHMVCTGHLHYSNVTILNKDNGQKWILVHAGSAFCARTKDGKNSFFCIDITEALNIKISRYSFHEGQFIIDKTW